MAAGSKPKYYLVEASVLPEIFAKVIEAKEPGAHGSGRRGARGHQPQRVL